jgi:hypothetical protein
MAFSAAGRCPSPRHPTACRFTSPASRMAPPSHSTNGYSRCRDTVRPKTSRRVGHLRAPPGIETAHAAMSSTATGTRIGIAASLDVNAAGGALVTFVLSRIVGLFGFSERGWVPPPHAAISVARRGADDTALGGLSGQPPRCSRSLKPNCCRAVSVWQRIVGRPPVGHR